jgi:hypothetical protein
MKKKINYLFYVIIIIFIIYIIFKLSKIKENFTYTKSRNYICYYTVFTGSNNNVAFKIPKLPSNYYDCYYYTNNKELYDELRNTKWKSILLDIEVSDDEIKSAMDAKYLKACPDLFKELNNYDYTVYFDSKLNLNCDKDVENIIETQMKDKVMILRRHNFLNDVWEEFNESMKQQRYKKEKIKYINYINKQLNNGFQSSTENHYVTNFIIRNNNSPIVKEINKTWYEHILECGIECQISFSFIQQIYSEYIGIIEYDQFNIKY